MGPDETRILTKIMEEISLDSSHRVRESFRLVLSVPRDNTNKNPCIFKADPSITSETVLEEIVTLCTFHFNVVLMKEALQKAEIKLIS
jgi:hypothetical protein